MALHLTDERGNLGEIGTGTYYIDDFQSHGGECFLCESTIVQHLDCFPGEGSEWNFPKTNRARCIWSTKGISRRGPARVKERGGENQSGRPTEWYSKPRAFMCVGESRLRPSRTRGRAIVSRMRCQSRTRNSSHSVRRRRASALIAVS